MQVLGLGLGLEGLGLGLGLGLEGLVLGLGLGLEGLGTLSLESAASHLVTSFTSPMSSYI